MIKISFILIVLTFMICSNIASSELITYRSCDIRANCSQHQICMNGLCKCEPNYSFKNGKCVQTTCTRNNNKCQENDKNRVCEELPFANLNYCVCDKGFVEDPVTKACRRVCTENAEPNCEITDGANSVCNVFLCQCKANYRRNNRTGHCEPFQCEIDAHCWSDGDRFRSCSNNTCVCPYEHDPLTDRCLIRITSIFDYNYYRSWKTERLLLATIIFVPIVFYYCLCQNYRKARSTIVYLRSPTPGQTFYSHQSALTKNDIKKPII